MLKRPPAVIEVNGQRWGFPDDIHAGSYFDITRLGLRRGSGDCALRRGSGVLRFCTHQGARVARWRWRAVSLLLASHASRRCWGSSPCALRDLAVSQAVEGGRRGSRVVRAELPPQEPDRHAAHCHQHVVHHDGALRHGRCALRALGLRLGFCSGCASPVARRSAASSGAERGQPGPLAGYVRLPCLLEPLWAIGVLCCCVQSLGST